MDCFTIEEARDRLDDLIERAASTGERIILTRDGREVAAIVHAEDARWLQELEDREDNAAADAALAEAAEKGTIPWETLKAELNLAPAP